MAAGQRSAGVVVVRREPAGWRYLVLRAFRNWDFPKGLIGAGEDALAAAVREVAEETSLTRLDFRWGHVCRETAPYGRGKIARYYLALASDGEVVLPVSPELGRPEHHQHRWASVEEARKLLPERLHPILEWARETVTAQG